MPKAKTKLKTNSGARKRFKLTASGRVARKRAYGRHMLTKRRMKVKRQARQGLMVSPADTAQIKNLL